MGLILWIMKWWLIIIGVSVATLVLLLAWDWFVWRRLPWARWRADHRPNANEWAIIREAIRIRRLRNGR